MRRKVVDFMLNDQVFSSQNVQEFKKVIDKDNTCPGGFDAYVRSFYQDGKWAEDLVIQATALFLKRNIHIFLLSNGQKLIIPGTLSQESERPRRTPLTLAAIVNVHFQSIIPGP
jgi:hypothetical protein